MVNFFGTSFSGVLRVYRETIKKNKFIHHLLYVVSTKLILPMLERIKGFYTFDEEAIYSRYELLLGQYERESTSVIKKIVRPGMICLDVGANIGYITRLLSDLVGHNGKVIAIEPHPKLFDILKKNTQKMRNVELANVAITDHEGTITLFDGLLSAGTTSIVPDDELASYLQSKYTDDETPRIKKGVETVTYKVATSTIDMLVNKMGISEVGFIKMDIEGAEILAIRGSRTIIGNSPNLSMMIEYNSRNQKKAGFLLQEFVETLREAGFNEILGIGDDGVFFSFDPLVDLVDEGVNLDMACTNLLVMKN